MSDTWDDCRAHVAEMKCERGDCDHNCQRCCEPDECALCTNPLEWDNDGEICRSCWSNEINGLFDA